MSMITRPLPDTVEVDGKKYRIYTDFRRWIELGIIMSDRSAPMEQKIIDALSLCYPRDSLPPSLEGAVNSMLRFYAGSLKTSAQDKNYDNKKKPIYDFEYDAEYIYAAFLEQYRIDLTTASLHWYQFKALFMGLDENCKISKIMEYRAIDLSKIKDKEQKAFYRKMKRIYRLPDMRTEEEKEADMVNALADIF